MLSKLLPIGSVVLLHGAEKRLMICSRYQEMVNDNHIYDYVGCFYPEGIVDSDNMFFFDHHAIAEIHHLGFEDQEEHDFKVKILSEL